MLKKHHDGEPAEPVPGVGLPEPEGELGDLSGVFAPPHWLRDLGRMSWAIVGIAAIAVGLTWVVGTAAAITQPVLIGLVVATVAAPLVTLLQRWRVPRAVGALLGLIALAVLTIGVVVVVLAGITAQSSEIAQHASEGAAKIEGWLKDAGVDAAAAASAKSTVESDVPSIIDTFLHGVISGIQGIASLAFMLAFTAFAVFFLLKDGPKLRTWLNGHLGVPPPVARTITSEVIASVRHYFTGVTIVAAFNGVVVTIGALALGVPLAGTIGVVTFITAYIPFIGAVISGAFAVLIALGAEGTSTALIMLVIVLLANGMLQNVVQPIAFGATLNLHPLLILVVTISAGALFGMAGLVLAAPLTSAAVHIVREVTRMRAAAGSSPAAAPPDAPDTPADPAAALA